MSQSQTPIEYFNSLVTRLIEWGRELHEAREWWEKNWESDIYNFGYRLVCNLVAADGQLSIEEAQFINGLLGQQKSIVEMTNDLQAVGKVDAIVVTAGAVHWGRSVT